MMELTVTASVIEGSLPHFWNSTGFTPAELLLDPDMKQAMAYTGSVPHGGVSHVRIHYLLGLVKARDLDTESRAYDWSKLDEGLDVLLENGVQPVFELMGNPSDYFTDFTDEAELRDWKRLVRDLAEHLIDRYGREEVASWYFETWNEPDIGWWHQWPDNEESFCNYYDACSAGLAEADDDLVLGGPGSARTLSSLFRTFVEHCDSGENRLTGEPVRLDFVSVHEKGRGTNDEDLAPDSAGILEREQRARDYLRENHPDLADLPFMNNECDPQTGWVDIHTWRAKPYYAALAAKIVGQHVDQFVDEGVDYALLSNDNGFLGTWGQRTHFARFGEGAFETDPNRASVRPHFEEFEFVKKPAHNVMTMLALLGDERVATTGGDGDIGAIATRRNDDEVSVLVYNSRDEIEAAGETEIRIAIEEVPFERAGFSEYRIDGDHGNPFRQWEAMDGPEDPAAEQLAELRTEQELQRNDGPRTVSLADGTFEATLNLPLPGVSLVHLCADPGEAPAAPIDLHADDYRGRTFGGDVFLRWDGVDSRAITTYEVLYAAERDGEYARINEVDFVSTAHLDATDEVDPGGYYKVRAVDYWGRTGPESEAIEAPQ
jgi:L-iduronidase